MFLIPEAPELNYQCLKLTEESDYVISRVSDPVNGTARVQIWFFRGVVRPGFGVSEASGPDPVLAREPGFKILQKFVAIDFFLNIS